MSAPPMPDPFVRPDVAAFLAYLNSVPGPKLHELPPADARAMASAMRHVADVETGPLAVLRDVTMPNGLTARLFDARANRAPGPVMVFVHGGGWVIGDLDSYESVCAEIARGLDMPVVSVSYRLAPEHPWPAAPDDCEAAARWIADAPAELGLAPTGLVLAGDSAGGNLAIVTAIALRDEPGAVPVLAHWAMYPAADMVERYDSFAQFAEGHFLTRDAMAWFADAYRPDVTHWRGSPMVADLAGLPPALVTTAGLDPIRDQGRAYAAALARAGVTVHFHEAAGTVHGFLNLRRAIPSANQDLAEGLIAFRGLLANIEVTA